MIMAAKGPLPSALVILVGYRVWHAKLFRHCHNYRLAGSFDSRPETALRSRPSIISHPEVDIRRDDRQPVGYGNSHRDER